MAETYNGTFRGKNIGRGREGSRWIRKEEVR